MLFVDNLCFIKQQSLEKLIKFVFEVQGINISEHQETERQRVDIPNRSAVAKQVIPESAICRQRISLRFDPIKKSFVFPAIPKIKIQRALTPEERVSIHIQQLKMKSKQSK